MISFCSSSSTIVPPLVDCSLKRSEYKSSVSNPAPVGGNQQASSIFLLHYIEALLTRSEPRWKHYLTLDALQKKLSPQVGLQELGASHIERFFTVMEQIQKQTAFK
jgi:hypothetical protein